MMKAHPECSGSFNLFRLLVLSGLPVLVACSDATDARSETVLRDSAGVTIVENASESWANRQPWRVSSQPVVRIGAVDSSEPAALFSYIRAARRLDNGNIVVVDGETNEIRWFRADGSHLATRGGKGRGPGEFTSITQLLRLAGDTVVAQDAPRIKQVIFSPTADLVREERIDGERYRSYGRWLECLTLTLPDRSLLGCQEEPGLPAGAPNTPGRLRTFARYVRVPWTMEASYRLGLHGGIEQWGVRGADGERHYAMHPYHARTAVAAGGDPLRVVIAINPEYSIEVWSPTGQLQRIVRRVAARHAPTESQRVAARGELREFSFIRDEALFNRMLAEMPEPDSIPAVAMQGLAVGPAGDLWVTRGRLFLASDSTDVDVFDAEGLFLGELKLAPRFRLFEVGRDYILGIRFDEDDVPSVEIYSLTR